VEQSSHYPVHGGIDKAKKPFHYKNMKLKTIPPLWENPEIQGINRLAMGSLPWTFASAQDALADAAAGPEFRRPEDNPCCLGLDGTWRFRLLSKPGADGEAGGEDFGLSPSWTQPDFDAASWADIRVPGTWTLQRGPDGKPFDKPHYTNVQMPFEGTPPEAPDHNPTGLYRRTFALPPSWKDRRVVLHVGSAESCCLVYVNGVFAGAGKDTRLPSEYDITPFLSETKENTLCLKVVRYSDASYVEDQDQWWYGGLHRSVYLYSTEACYIKDVAAIPGAVVEEDGKSRGQLRLEVTLGGAVPAGRSTGNVGVGLSSGEAPFTVTYALYPFTLPASREGALEFAAALGSKIPALLLGELTLDCIYSVNANRVEADLVLDKPALWSHEAPNLYILLVSLLREGRHIQSAAFLTGFRNIRVARRELLINEKAVLIKGVNRHEHDEKTGKTLSTAAMVRDIELLKTHNFNAVRTCHYPNDERWYELCDRYGIYLVDEANIEHHCFYEQLCRDTAWSYAYIARVQRMAERDKNHPSVIIWSLGNESGDGANHNLAGAWLRRFDPSRPVNYEGAVRPEGGQGGFTLDSLNRGRGLTDLISPMYPSIKLITDFVTYREDDRPLILIEYSHAMGNSNGSLADYWEAIETRHGLQGGFIWDWIDQGLEAFTPEGTKYWKYGGDFGDEPSDYDFCLNGLLFPDQSPKPAMAECKQVFAPLRLKVVSGKAYTFIVENRFDFSILEGIELAWTLNGEDGVLAKGVETLPPLAPGNAAEIELPVPKTLDLQAVPGTVYIHGDFRLSRDLGNIPGASWTRAGFVLCSGEKLLRETPRSLTITEGAAPELARFGELFTPSLFRAPTENDGLKLYIPRRGDPGAQFYYQDKAMYPWLDLDLLHLRLADEKNEEILWEGYKAQLYRASLLAGEKAAPGFEKTRLGVYTRIAVAPSAKHPGILDFTFDLDPALPELPKVGLSARIPGYYSHISWFGLGPQESYPDRCMGAFLGRYEDTPASLEVPYIMPQENGNRSGVRSITLSGPQVPRDKPGSILIRPNKPVNMGASRYSPENLFTGLHTPDLKDLSQGPDGYWFLSLDIAQRGLGTGSCGPDTLEAYRIFGGSFGLRLFIGA
jgi:beta-galactosidase